MQAEYALTIMAKCPVDGSSDFYALTVRADRMVRVEDILKAVQKATRKPIFQEDLTSRLQRKLACEVETFGTHSRVRTKVLCKG